MEAAGVGQLYGGRTVTDKMRTQRAKRMSAEQLVTEMQRAHTLLGGSNLTIADFNRLSEVTNSAAVSRRFGSWPKGLKKAGIGLSNLGRRYSDRECLENLVNVWTHYGRQPHYEEMNRPPSVVGIGAYVIRWGGWRKAVKAFVEWANADEPNQLEASPELLPERPLRIRTAPEDRHDVPARLRWKVVVRDRFRCVACGRSPANELTVELHVDHRTPWADGGKTVLDNLQTLCRECNLGKGKSYASVG